MPVVIDGSQYSSDIETQSNRKDLFDLEGFGNVVIVLQGKFEIGGQVVVDASDQFVGENDIRAEQAFLEIAERFQISGVGDIGPDFPLIIQDQGETSLIAEPFPLVQAIPLRK